MVRCLMCDKDVQLYKPNSHVVPKWCFREIRNPDGRLPFMDVFNHIKTKSTQFTEYGDFICDDCETETSKLDTYASNTLSISQLKKSRKFIYDENLLTNTFSIKNVDNIKIIKFIWSVTIRKYIFNKVVLGDKINILSDSNFKLLKDEYKSLSINPEKFNVILEKNYNPTCSLPEKEISFEFPSVRCFLGDFSANIYLVDCMRERSEGSKYQPIPLIGDITSLIENKDSFDEKIQRVNQVVENGFDIKKHFFVICGKCHRKLRSRKTHGVCSICQSKIK